MTLGLRVRITVIDTQLNTPIHFFEPRVPAGYEPSIRNQVFPIGSLPNGFAFSFLGDRKVYIIDFEGILKNVVELGESDPIPDPFKINDPSESPGAKPYITKIEFFRNHLLILMENHIWLLEYPSLEPKKILKIKKNIDDETSPVIDFSITKDLIYLRIGREGLYSIKTEQKWFE